MVIRSLLQVWKWKTLRAPLPSLSILMERRQGVVPCGEREIGVGVERGEWGGGMGGGGRGGGGLEESTRV